MNFKRTLMLVFILAAQAKAVTFTLDGNATYGMTAATGMGAITGKLGIAGGGLAIEFPMGSHFGFELNSNYITRSFQDPVQGVLNPGVLRGGGAIKIWLGRVIHLGI